MEDKVSFYKINYKPFASVLLILSISLSAFLFSGCDSNKFSKLSTYEKANNNSVTVLVKDESITREGLIIVITNKTNADIIFDSTFIIEQKRNEKWYRSEKGQYFDALGRILNANSSSEFEVWVDEKLSIGNYRVIKPFVISSKTIEFDVEFSIE